MSIRNKIPLHSKVHPDIQDLVDIIESSKTPNIPALMMDAYKRGKRVGKEQLSKWIMEFLNAYGLVNELK